MFINLCYKQNKLNLDLDSFASNNLFIIFLELKLMICFLFRIDLLCEEDPTNSIDLSLSFLDEFVCESLEKGDIPYMSSVYHQLTPTVQNLLIEEDSFSSSTQLSSPHSSGRGSIEILSPCDGGSFSGFVFKNLLKNILFSYMKFIRFFFLLMTLDM